MYELDVLMVFKGLLLQVLDVVIQTPLDLLSNTVGSLDFVMADDGSTLKQAGEAAGSIFNPGAENGNGTDLGGFLSGDNFRHLMQMAFDTNKNYALTASFANVARIIAAILCLLNFSGKAYKYMTGEEQWKILPLLRPFALLMVILNWGWYCNFCQWPARSLCTSSYDNVALIMQKYSDTSEKRWATIDTLTWRLYEKEKLTGQAEQALNDDVMMQAIISFFSVSDVNELNGMAVAGASWAVKSIIWFCTFLIEKIGLLFLQFSVILVLLMQAVFCGILYCIGPLAFGFSVLGMWQNSWQQWTTRYITTNFFACLLFVAITICWTLLNECITAESSELAALIAETNDPLGTWENFYKYIGDMGSTTVLYIACIMASSGAAMYVPTCATWIIETSGVGNATTGIMSGVGAVTMGMSRIASYTGSFLKGASSGAK